jgi:hypothetical protein
VSRLPQDNSEAPQNRKAKMEVTKEEKDILRHTLGLDYNPEPFRNYFVSGTRCDNFKDLEKLVELGLMTKRKDPFDEVNESFVFHATKKGKEVALDKGGNPATNKQSVPCECCYENKNIYVDAKFCPDCGNQIRP